MSIYTGNDSDISSSDNDLDENQIPIELEKQENEEFLFTKATTNNSIESLETKDNADVVMKDVVENDRIFRRSAYLTQSEQDDDVSKSLKPSPSKKHKKTELTTQDTPMDPGLIRNMFCYFEENNIDIFTIEVDSVTKATTTVTAALLAPTDVQENRTARVEASIENTSNLEKYRGPLQDQNENPGPVTGPGASL